jgi:hypothetical protein
VLDVPNTTDFSDQVDGGATSTTRSSMRTTSSSRCTCSCSRPEFDRRAEAQIPSADDLGSAFEDFLRDQRDD